jgi:hypothetical protein
MRQHIPAGITLKIQFPIPVGADAAGLRWRRSAALQGKLHMEASGLLQTCYYLEEITRLGISFRAKHAHEALCGFGGKTAQLFKAYRGVNVITQNGFAGLELSGEKTFNAFAQKLVPKSWIASDAGLNGLFEIPR